jgi:hypothetical protein
MELIITLIVLIIIWCIAFLIGAKQGTNRTINQIKKDGGYYDMEYTSSVYPILEPTSSFNSEVPQEWLANGDKERALHIAGIKEATPAKITEWENERRAKVETKTELSMDSLLSKLNKTDLQIKAGIIENTDKTGADIKIQVKELDPIDEVELTKLRVRAEKKQHEMDRENKLKIDFDALNFSRISNEARKQITEIVKLDLENKIRNIEKNTPEIVEDDTMGSIGSKPKTQTDYQREHKIPPCVGHELESQKENDKEDINFMYNWIREKSGKKTKNN